MPKETRDSRTKVLVVDDEGDTRTFLTDLLSTEGYDVHTVEDGLQAYMELVAEAYDLIITDVRMPGVSGMEFLSHVQRVAPKTKVILLTAYGDWDLYSEALKLGAMDLVNKPFEPSQLLNVVRWALARRGDEGARTAPVPETPRA
ncbi:MAG: response regulator [Planctomycetes bacterium]|nr:response regulator [Planctomycetota bacterium]